MDHKKDIDPDKVSVETYDWVENFVIRHGLCPFARAPFQAGIIRFSVSMASNEQQLAEDLLVELQELSRTPSDETETTLLIHPCVLSDFQQYNDFLDVVDTLLEDSGLVGLIQVASFHPDYCFAGCDEDDIANATNRSPWPMLHLLREKSITEAVADCQNKGLDVSMIPDRNIDYLRKFDKEQD